MCELVSAATMSSMLGTKAAALTVLDVVSVAGTVMGAMGSYQQGQYQQGMAEYNAKVAENNAITQQYQAADALARGQIAEDKHREKVRQLIGSQRANAGASGIDVNSGSAAWMQDEAAALGEEDALTIRTNAAREAWGHRVGASNYQAQAMGSRLEGSMAARAGTSRATSTLLTGAADFGAKRKWWS